MNGDDSAPPPLAYHSASIAFCLLTQLCRYASIKKLDITSMKLSQENRFAMEGSVIQGNLTGQGVKVVTHLEIESNESEETIRRMIEVGENGCFIHQSIKHSVPPRSKPSPTAKTSALLEYWSCGIQRHGQRPIST